MGQSDVGEQPGKTSKELADLQAKGQMTSPTPSNAPEPTPNLAKDFPECYAALEHAKECDCVVVQTGKEKCDYCNSNDRKAEAWEKENEKLRNRSDKVDALIEACENLVSHWKIVTGINQMASLSTTTTLLARIEKALSALDVEEARTK